MSLFHLLVTSSGQKALLLPFLLPVLVPLCLSMMYQVMGLILTLLQNYIFLGLAFLLPQLASKGINAELVLSLFSEDN